MRLDLGSLLSLARDSVSDPRPTARRLIALDLPMEARWLAMAATVALSVLMTQIALMALAVPTEGEFGGALVSPLAAAAVQGATILILAAGIARIGAMAGGQGGFPDALLLVTWAEFVLVILQAVQILVTLLFPFSSFLIGFAGIVLFFWLLTQFTAELHGFQSAPKVFLALLGGFFVAGFLLLILAGAVGLTPADMGV